MLYPQISKDMRLALGKGSINKSPNERRVRNQWRVQTPKEFKKLVGRESPRAHIEVLKGRRRRFDPCGILKWAREDSRPTGIGSLSLLKAAASGKSLHCVTQTMKHVDHDSGSLEIEKMWVKHSSQKGNCPYGQTRSIAVPLLGGVRGGFLGAINWVVPKIDLRPSGIKPPISR